MFVGQQQVIHLIPFIGIGAVTQGPQTSRVFEGIDPGIDRYVVLQGHPRSLSEYCEEYNGVMRTA
jgi:hypothetical protein